MIVYRGERRTPKQLAALLLVQLLDLMPDDWRPAAEVTPAEERAVREQLAKFKGRIETMLRVEDKEAAG